MKDMQAEPEVEVMTPQQVSGDSSMDGQRTLLLSGMKSTSDTGQYARTDATSTIIPPQKFGI